MYYLYLLRCEGGSIYCGITTDLERRLKEHQSGKGAKYTKTHKPIGYAAAFSAEGRSLASKLEHWAKTLSHSDKEKLASGELPLPDYAEGSKKVM